MSAWKPIKDRGVNGIQRIWSRYGSPTAVADIRCVPSADGFEYYVCCGASAGGDSGTVIARARTDDMESAKAVASALAKFARSKHARLARRKAVRAARANMALPGDDLAARS
ncbi:MAG TPA: hypothetical protein PLZ74_06940 [Kiritimatiellia bacterium]|nr:hypothetical protein [Kiritimatiellia bacterium]